MSPQVSSTSPFTTVTPMIDQFLNFRRNAFRQGKHAADMESADQDLHPSGPELPRQVRRTRELVGLDSHQRDDGASVGKPVGPDDPLDGNLLNRVVDQLDRQFGFRAQQFSLRHVLCEAGEASQRVAWEHASKMADDVTLVVVLGWLYKNDFDFFPF